MSSVFLLNAGATAGYILQTTLFGTDHVEDFSIMITFLVTLDVVYFLFRDHLFYNLYKISIKDFLI